MLTVIFGAGASFDSVDAANVTRSTDVGYQPPLARELFDVRPTFGDAITRYDECAAVLAELRRGVAAELEVEALLEALKSEADRYPMNHVHLAAIQFYLRDILWDCGNAWPASADGVTNYAGLMNSISRWRAQHAPDETVNLVTFNYDVILERACRPYGFRLVDSLDAYLDWNGYSILKPHGSVNWVRPTADPLPANFADHEVVRYLIGSAPVALADSYELIAERTQVQRVEPTARWGLHPAIAIPVENKDASSFVFPESHLEALKRALEGTTRLVVIGWRVTEQHFLDLMKLSGARAQVAIVVDRNEDSARAIMDRLISVGVTDNVTARIPLGGGFTDFVRRGDEIGALLSSR